MPERNVAQSNQELQTDSVQQQNTKIVCLMLVQRSQPILHSKNLQVQTYFYLIDLTIIKQGKNKLKQFFLSQIQGEPIWNVFPSTLFVIIACRIYLENMADPYQTYSNEPLLANRYPPPPPPLPSYNTPSVNNANPYIQNNNNPAYIADQQGYSAANQGYNSGNQGYNAGNQGYNQGYNNQPYNPNNQGYNPNPPLNPYQNHNANQGFNRNQEYNGNQGFIPPPVPFIPPAGLVCPLCRKQTTSVVRKVAGGVTWIWCFILFIFTGVCCCIPFCVDNCKDTEMMCAVCQSPKARINANCC